MGRWRICFSFMVTGVLWKNSKKMEFCLELANYALVIKSSGSGSGQGSYA